MKKKAMPANGPRNKFASPQPQCTLKPCTINAMADANMMTFMDAKTAKIANTPKPPEMPDLSPKKRKNPSEAISHAPEIQAAFVCCVTPLEAATVPRDLDGLGSLDSNGVSSMAQMEYSSEYSLPQYGHRFMSGLDLMACEEISGPLFDLSRGLPRGCGAWPPVWKVLKDCPLTARSTNAPSGDRAYGKFVGRVPSHGESPPFLNGLENKKGNRHP